MSTRRPQQGKLRHFRGPPTHAEFRKRLQDAKSSKTLELLFRVARVAEETARARANREHGYALRRAHTALLPFVELEGTRLTVLAERLGVSKQAVGEWVDELVTFGVLERRPDPTDRRAKRVHFTDAGRQGLLTGLASLETFEKEIARSVGAAALRSLRVTLEALWRHLEAERVVPEADRAPSRPKGSVTSRGPQRTTSRRRRS